MSTTQNAFNLRKLGWVGKPISWSGKVWLTPPTYNPDGSPLVIGIPQDISLWIFMLTVKASYSDSDDNAIFKPDWQIPAGTGASGAWQKSMSDSITKNLTPGVTLVWDMAVIPVGLTDPIMIGGGTIIILNTVTRRFIPVLTP